MSMEWGRKDFGISCFQTLLFLIEVILPGVCAYVLAVIEVSDVVHLFSRGVVSGGLVRLFFSDAFSLILVHAFLAQIYSTMFVISFARLCRTGHFRARAKAILAGLPKRTVPATFFFFFFLVMPAAFRLQDVLGEDELPLMLLGGGAAFLAAMVSNAVVFHNVWAVPLLEDARGIDFGAISRRLALVGSGKLYAGATALALLDGLFVPVALLTAASPSKVLAVATATSAVQCTVMVVMQVTQPLVYMVLWEPAYEHTYRNRRYGQLRFDVQRSGGGVSWSLRSIAASFWYC